MAIWVVRFPKEGYKIIYIFYYIWTYSKIIMFSKWCLVFLTTCLVHEVFEICYQIWCNDDLDIYRWDLWAPLSNFPPFWKSGFIHHKFWFIAEKVSKLAKNWNIWLLHSQYSRNINKEPKSGCLTIKEWSTNLYMGEPTNYGNSLHWRPKIHSHSKIFRYGQSIFCLPHHPDISDIFDLCLHWVSVIHERTKTE